LELSLGSRTNAAVLEAERALGGTAACGQSTFEALAVGSSSESLESGESGRVLGAFIVAVVVDVGVNESAAVRSGVIGA